jgi:DNA-binding transcriptional MerR regulator
MAKAKSSGVVDITGTEEFLTVTQLAEVLGVTARTIRFYEDKGLISPRRAGNTRIYAPRDRARMVLILRGKRLGFSLRDIKLYLDLYDMDPLHELQNKVLLKGVRERIARLKDQREALEETLEGLYEMEKLALEALEQRGWAARKRTSSDK